MAKVIKSIYGNVALMRAKCPECNEISIILDGLHQCCDVKAIKTDRETKKRMYDIFFLLL